MSRRSIPVMVCFGTRPEVIKLAPVLAAMHEHDQVTPIGVSIAQHDETFDRALETFGIVPDVQLGATQPGLSIDELAAHALATLGSVVRSERPRAIIVQGDATTALCAALVGFWLQVPVAHVEAGLRTWDRAATFPEETTRQMIASIADWHFCPTTHAADNLRREGIHDARIQVAGSTAVDALHMVLQQPGSADQLPPRTRARRLLVTMHRPESQGAVQRELARVLVRVAARRDVEVIMPVHPDPAVREVIAAEAAGQPGIVLVEPVEYAAFVRLIRSSDIVLTDGGGMQEEAPALGVPLLVMRDTTERPEGVDAGCVSLCGTEPERVEAQLVAMLDDQVVLDAMSCATHPYGDGAAARRITATLARELAMAPGDRTAVAAPAFATPIALTPLRVPALT